MHAHINVWKISNAGDSRADTIASEIAQTLRGQPGFHAYTLVRTDDNEVVAMTMFETSAQLHAAFEALDEQTRAGMQHTTSGKPEHRAGEVILHEMLGAWPLTSILESCLMWTD